MSAIYRIDCIIVVVIVFLQLQAKSVRSDDEAAFTVEESSVDEPKQFLYKRDEARVSIC